MDTCVFIASGLAVLLVIQAKVVVFLWTRKTNTTAMHINVRSRLPSPDYLEDPITELPRCCSTFTCENSFGTGRCSACNALPENPWLSTSSKKVASAPATTTRAEPIKPVPQPRPTSQPMSKQPAQKISNIPSKGKASGKLESKASQKNTACMAGSRRLTSFFGGLTKKAPQDDTGSVPLARYANIHLFCFTAFLL